MLFDPQQTIRFSEIKKWYKVILFDPPTRYFTSLQSCIILELFALHDSRRNLCSYCNHPVFGEQALLYCIGQMENRWGRMGLDVELCRRGSCPDPVYEKKKEKKRKFADKSPYFYITMTMIRGLFFPSPGQMN